MEAISEVTLSDIKFRPSKRRRIIPRAQSDEEDEQTQQLGEPSTSTALTIISNPTPAAPAIPRRRTGGILVNYRANLPSAEADEQSDSQDGPVPMIARRFVKPTSQTTESDKHMAAFIDRELAKLRNADSENRVEETKVDSIPLTSNEISKQTSSGGRLEEVDIDDLPARRRRERSEYGRRRVNGKWMTVPRTSKDAASDEDAPSPATTETNFRPRNRSQRATQDPARDSIIEEMLSGPGPSIFNQGLSGELMATKMHRSDDLPTDDQVAAEFVKEYLESQTVKRQKLPPPNAKGPNAGKEDEKAKKGGPKLGGSRMARAQMREREVRAEKESEKNRKR